MKNIKPHQIATLRRIVYRHYRSEGRHDLPWRRTSDPYHILVSEVMLQQTQVPRVVPKFVQFIGLFPTPAALARAPLKKVLSAWNGLGYNRRALYLKRAAEIIAIKHDGRVPDTVDELATLPGIGLNTAGAILAYAYDRPVVYLETNIRAVLLHHFFHGQAGVEDRVLLPLATRVLDREHPRCWHSALMDYGTWLKQQHPNPGRASAQHSRQSRFEGSNRQLRGTLIRLLTRQAQTIDQLCGSVDRPRSLLLLNLAVMEREGLITHHSGKYRIS